MKQYGAITAVGGLSLAINEGEVFGLLGPNGAGKSTTLYMLCGLVTPTSGSVTLFGRDLHDNFIPVISRVGILTERPAFYNHLSIRRNMQLLAMLGHKDVNIDRALDRVGLLNVAQRRVGTLSHGMRQRLGLAQALLSEPELVILDEPTAGLDPESTQEILQLLRFLADEAKVTVIFSSHQLQEVEYLCDRVGVINQGKLVACEEVENLLSYDPSQVDVLVDSLESASKRLAEQSWVKSVENAKGRLRVHLNGGTVHQLTAFLVSSGYKVSGIMPRQRTLQEYFLKVLNR
ncbi:MAG TPA: ABC transporter ATP-binding protein [Candidatus Hydrogenedentes bacterium]|nr:ABC transporter ATP-binding protein [Candidatus Hydrogenedentota bacterium]